MIEEEEDISSEIDKMYRKKEEETERAYFIWTLIAFIGILVLIFTNIKLAIGLFVLVIAIVSFVSIFSGVSSATKNLIDKGDE